MVVVSVAEATPRRRHHVFHAIVVETKDAQVGQMNETAQGSQHVVLQIHTAQIVERLLLLLGKKKGDYLLLLLLLFLLLSF